jgi:hypothetical protein
MVMYRKMTAHGLNAKGPCTHRRRTDCLPSTIIYFPVYIYLYLFYVWTEQVSELCASMLVRTNFKIVCGCVAHFLFYKTCDHTCTKTGVWVTTRQLSKCEQKSGLASKNTNPLTSLARGVSPLIDPFCSFG